MTSHLACHRYVGPRHARPDGPRHAKPMPPTTAHRAFAATGAAAAIVAGETVAFAGGAGAATADDFARLRMCESSGNYAINTGNGYYGAYQFDLRTWKGLGYSGLPSAAPPAVQDQAAQRLFDSRGWEPWPACSVKLGLVDDRTASRSAPRPPLAAAPAAPAAPAPAPAAPTSVPAGVPAWDGHYLSVRDVGSVRGDVREWQTQMVAAGYHIAIDGKYGPQSAAAATQYEIDHHLSVEHPGVVGPQVWGTLFGA
jgi:hypothetical protein